MLQIIAALPRKREMEQKLWQLRDQSEVVGECEQMRIYESLDKFLKMKVWITPWIRGCKPIYWHWCDRTSDEYQDEHEDESFDEDIIDYLNLFWMRLDSCSLCQAVVHVRKEEEAQARFSYL